MEWQMTDRNVLDFRSQAEQMIAIIESRLDKNQKNAALELLILKFKALYEQGVASGRLYEKEGLYPFAAFDDSKWILFTGLTH